MLALDPGDPGTVYARAHPEAPGLVYAAPDLGGLFQIVAVDE